MLNVIVIGVGTMGSSTCMHLARRGCRVLGLDQFNIPSQLASHHGKSRMFRMSYYEHADYVPLLQRSLEQWRALELQSKAGVFHITGGLYIGPEAGDLISGSLASARQHNLAHETLSPNDLARCFPQIRVDPTWIGMLERDAGFVVPELAVSAFADEARKAGAELRAREPVLKWSADSRGVRVETERGVYYAEKLVICSGPWSQKVITGLGITISITRQVLGWVSPREPGLFELGRLPVFAIERDRSSLYYGFPTGPHDRGFKIALHGRGMITDPDRVSREATAADEAEWRAGIRGHFPRADGPTLAQAVCMYDNSPDGHFILDRHPDHENVVIGCGFSGHGFKFAPVIGEILSDLSTHGTTTLPAGFLGLKRFAAQGLR